MRSTRRRPRPGTEPARIELSRLTVRQYRNAVADLIGSFRDPTVWDGPKGLHGEYFKSHRFRTRTTGSSTGSTPRSSSTSAWTCPTRRKIDGHQFSIRWEGSVLAPETGDYEFIVRTEHATRLWVNEQEAAHRRWVKSGNDTEFRDSIFLLGGRVYPIRLEFSKAKQGVEGRQERS